MEKFRRNQSGDTFIKINSDNTVTKVIVREFDIYKKFVLDVNQVNPEQLAAIEQNYPIKTRESLYLHHLYKLSKKINSEINCSIENLQD